MKVHRALCRVVLALVACNPQKADDADGDASSSSSAGATALPTTGAGEGATSGGTTGEGTTSEGTTGDACLEVVERCACDLSPGPWQLTCGLPEVCPGDGPLEFTLEDWDPIAGGPPGSATVDDLERARCVARALRDRTPGQYALYRIFDDVNVLDVVAYEILGEQAIGRSEAMHCQLSSPPLCAATVERLVPLRTPAFFAACAEGDARALFLCMSEAFESEPGCAPGPLVCP